MRNERETFTASDLVRLTGAKPRTIQFAADNGVFEPLAGTDRKGTGTHRQFSRDEAIVACVAIAFAARKLSIGEVINVATAVRKQLKRPTVRAIVEDVIAGKTEAFIVIATAAPGEWGCTIFETASKKFEENMASMGVAIWNLLTMKKQPGVIATTLWLNACLAKFSE